MQALGAYRDSVMSTWHVTALHSLLRDVGAVKLYEATRCEVVLPQARAAASTPGGCTQLCMAHPHTCGACAGQHLHTGWLNMLSQLPTGAQCMTVVGAAELCAPHGHVSPDGHYRGVFVTRWLPTPQQGQPTAVMPAPV
jgi:hypothetical protein